MFAPKALYFKLDDGETATVRFLEEDDDVQWCYVHNVPVEGRSWGQDVPCLDQEEDDEPCPGCERELKRSVKGYINLIWFDAPLYKTDPDGKLVKDKAGDKIEIGNQDQVAVWNSGIRLFEQLDELNETYKGLRGRKFKVKRKGVKLNTTYVILPDEDGPQPLSAKEVKLDESKYDLNEFMKQISYEDFENLITGGSATGGRSKKNAVAAAKKQNPFLNNRS